MRNMDIAIERFPIAGRFVISRGAKTEAVVVTATIADGPRRGRGECVPYGRYCETVESVMAQIAGARAAIEAGASLADLQTLMPAGAARNAIDCALWDLAAKQAGKRAHELAGLAAPGPVTTAYTISVGSPDEMATAAAKAAARPLLKIKLAGEGDAERLRAVRRAAPQSRLIVDANEAWSEASLQSMLALCAAEGVALVEQPLPAGRDGMLARIYRPVPVCADESVHATADLPALRACYDAVNLKLDKTGGLTEAIAFVKQAQALGFELMVGCMVGTSLAMAPALLIAGEAAFVDLDGPLLLAQDRPDGLVYDGPRVSPPTPELWG